MSRPTKSEKKRIVVFCEGESEQAYMRFLKEKFGEVATFKWPKAPGLFEEADRKFKKDKTAR